MNVNKVIISTTLLQVVNDTNVNFLLVNSEDVRVLADPSLVTKLVLSGANVSWVPDAVVATITRIGLSIVTVFTEVLDPVVPGAVAGRAAVNKLAVAGGRGRGASEASLKLLDAAAAVLVGGVSIVAALSIGELSIVTHGARAGPCLTERRAAPSPVNRVGRDGPGALLHATFRAEGAVDPVAAVIVISAGIVIIPGSGDTVDLLVGTTLELLLDLSLNLFDAKGGRDGLPEPQGPSVHMVLFVVHERVLGLSLWVS